MLVKRSHGFASETELNLERTGENLKFHGMPSYHDDQEGRRRGPNTIWHWFWEGVHFAHFGDIGHLLSDEQLQTLGKVDVVFIPVGG